MLNCLQHRLLKNDSSNRTDFYITVTFSSQNYNTYNRSKVLLSIQRLLNVACNYIIVVEDGYSLPRHSPPHGSCFHGYPIQIHVACETNKTEVDLVSHSNETLSAARRKIAVKLDCSVEAVQVYMNDKIVSF